MLVSPPMILLVIAAWLWRSNNLTILSGIWSSIGERGEIFLERGRDEGSGEERSGHEYDNCVGTTQ